MDIAAYLERIGYEGSVDPTDAVLRDLQIAHLRTVPFENLDVRAGRELCLDADALFEKIVTQRRGGFCYELNGLFANLLERLGYRVTLISARPSKKEGGFYPEFDHLALIVSSPLSFVANSNKGVYVSIENLKSRACPERSRRIENPKYLVDVGWGNSFVEPLRLDMREEQIQGLLSYRIDRDGEDYILWERDYSGDWDCQYAFTLKPRRYEEFHPMCRWHQTSPESPFTQKRICTLNGPHCRWTLSESRLIITQGGVRTERAIAGEAEYNAILNDIFGVCIHDSRPEPRATASLEAQCTV